MKSRTKLPAGSASTIWMLPSAVAVVLVDSSSVRALLDPFLVELPEVLLAPKTGDGGGTIFSLQHVKDCQRLAQ